MVVELGSFLNNPKKYRNKVIVFSDCPVLVTDKVVTTNYHMFINPTGGARIWFSYEVKEGLELVTSYLDIKERLLYLSSPKEGIACDIHGSQLKLVLPFYKNINKRVQYFKKDAERSVQNYEQLLKASKQKIKQVNTVLKEYPDLFI